LNVVIRPALPDDAAACAAIYAPFVTDSWVSSETEPPDTAEMAKRIADYGTSHGWLIAELDNNIAGYAYASPHRSRSAYSTSVDVAVYIGNQYGRCGIGAALYNALFSALREKAFMPHSPG
jgi:L-amino acid N-acyltransferase YncA